MTPPSQLISLLGEEQMKRHEWLLRAGKLARKLNEESKHD